jgi:hypothetical protein
MPIIKKCFYLGKILPASFLDKAFGQALAGRRRIRTTSIGVDERIAVRRASCRLPHHISEVWVY